MTETLKFMNTAFDSFVVDEVESYTCRHEIYGQAV
jgi:hypothetical protein